MRVGLDFEAKSQARHAGSAASSASLAIGTSKEFWEMEVDRTPFDSDVERWEVL